MSLQRALVPALISLTTLAIGTIPTPAMGQTNAELDRKIEILSKEIENLKLGDSAARADRNQYGLGPAASKVYRNKEGVSLGGYGELIFRNPMAAKDDGTPSGEYNTGDTQRVIAYLGYKFSDRIVLNSEIEFEHARTETGPGGQVGAVAVEFTYMDFFINPGFNLRAGNVLMPVGLINELHEPTVFLGVARPEVERKIIPATWNEFGVGVFGDVGNFSYRSYVTTALDAQGFDAADGVRDGRQGASEAVFERPAWVGRLDYTGVAGLLVGASHYRTNAAQGVVQLGTLNLAMTEAHLDLKWNSWDIRSVYAMSTLGGTDVYNLATGNTGTAGLGSKQYGYYFQLGYNLRTLLNSVPGLNKAAGLTPFVRYERLDTQAAVAANATRDPANDRQILTLGFQVKPIEQVVFTVDYQDWKNQAGTGINVMNMGLGWVF
ncbi:MAG: hypothetical protein JNL01_06545 [Bdellovibrionales bacterium]|nr:hypothetical protein [Bdellovibrionales bacterium]